MSRLNEENAHEALSYTWGDSSLSHSIYIGGHPFEVTESLHTTLRYLRAPQNMRWLWIDAIYINQSDIQERTQQVRQIRSIYAGASQVLIWLGESDPDIDDAMDVLYDLSSTWKRPPAFHEIKAQREPVLLGIGKLLQKPWWNRVWVVQETAVCPKVPLILCGEKTAAYDMLVGIQLACTSSNGGIRSTSLFPK